MSRSNRPFARTALALGSGALLGVAGLLLWQALRYQEPRILAANNCEVIVRPKAQNFGVEVVYEFGTENDLGFQLHSGAGGLGQESIAEVFAVNADGGSDVSVLTLSSISGPRGAVCLELVPGGPTGARCRVLDSGGSELTSLPATQLRVPQGRPSKYLESRYPTFGGHREDVLRYFEVLNQTGYFFELRIEQRAGS